MDFQYYSDSLENYILNFDPEKINSSEINQTKRLVIDFLACVLAGFSHEKGKNYTNFINEKIKSLDDIFSNNISSKELASILSALSQVYDYNDGHSIAAQNHGCFHPGRIILPVAISLGFRHKSSKNEIMSAIMMGYEVAGLIQEENFPIDSLAAFVVAAKLLKLNKNQIRNGLGICAYLAPKKHNFIVGALFDTNFINYGEDVRNGVHAAKLSLKNFTGPTLGDFLKKYKFSNQQVSQIFEIYQKPYPTCRMTHPAIEAAIFLRDNHQFNLNEIESITILQLPEGMYVCALGSELIFPEKGLFYHQKFLVSLALIESKIKTEDLNLKKFSNLEIQNLIKKVNIKPHLEYSKNYPIEHSGLVEIKFNSGKILKHEIIHPKGHPENPLNDKELLEKYNIQNSEMNSSKKIDEIINYLS